MIILDISEHPGTVRFPLRPGMTSYAGWESVVEDLSDICGVSEDNGHIVVDFSPSATGSPFDYDLDSSSLAAAKPPKQTSSSRAPDWTEAETEALVSLWADECVQKGLQAWDEINPYGTTLLGNWRT